MNTEDIFADLMTGKMDKQAALTLLKSAKRNSPGEISSAPVDPSSGSIKGIRGGVIGTLVQAISQAVNVPESEIDIDENLMELGFDSIKLISLAEQLETQLNITLYPTVFFEYQTISDVASYFVDTFPHLLTDTSPAANVVANVVTAKPAMSVQQEHSPATLRRQVLQRLTQIIANAVSLPESEIDPDINLMELGLDSTKLIQLTDTIEKTLDITLYPTVFFEYQNLNEVAGYFEDQFGGDIANTLNTEDSGEGLASLNETLDTAEVIQRGQTSMATPSESNDLPLTAKIAHLLTLSIAKAVQLPPEEIEADVNLMDMGLDSTRLIQLSDQLEGDFDITLYPTVFFEHQTIEDVATYFAGEFHEQFSQISLVDEPSEQQSDVAALATDEPVARVSVPQTPQPEAIRWSERACTYHYAWQPVVTSDQLPGFADDIVLLHHFSDQHLPTLVSEHSHRFKSVVSLTNGNVETVVLPETAEQSLQIMLCFNAEYSVTETSRRITFSVMQLLKNWSGKGTVRFDFVVFPGATLEAQYFALAAFAATIRAEYPAVATRVMAVDEKILLPDIAALCAEVKVAKRKNGIWYERVISSSPLQNVPSTQIAMRQQGVYLITGGTGGLGRLLAMDIARRYQCKVILCGRRKQDSDIDRLLLEIAKFGGEGRYMQGDISVQATVEEIISRTKREFGSINGIVHAAGVLNDSAIARKSTSEFNKVVSPKVDAVNHLDTCTMNESLDFFAVFSSVSGVTGNHGQSDYSYANGYLDGYIVGRDDLVRAGERTGKSIAVQWPLWADGGMRPHASVIVHMKNEYGLDLVTESTGIPAFYQSLASTHANLMYLEGNKAVIESWLKPTVVASLIKAPSLNNVQQKNLPEFPAAIPVASSDIAVVGYHCEFPGSPDPDSFWQNLITSQDLIGHHQERWHFDGLAENMGFSDEDLSYLAGGFINDVSCFDNEFFKISAAEAQYLDPQQRRFLQVSWAAFESAGINPLSLKGSRTGVFVGASPRDYTDRLLMISSHTGISSTSLHPHVSTGLALNNIPNRLSYFLDLKGPSELVDTACSSSLVAIDRAVNSIATGQSTIAIAGGVNLLLTPIAFWAFRQTGILSPDYRCQTFDEKANGYVRGEGIGAIVMKPLQAAIQAGDTIHAIIKGSAVNHGGHGQSMTAPNSVQQANVVVSAMRKAGFKPETVGYVEAHGTGTALGDPVEIQGLKRAFGLSGATGTECGVGTVKSNIGHLEAAAGIAGIIKVLLCMKYKQLPESLHVSTPNPYINLAQSPFFIVRESQPWLRKTNEQGDSLPLRAGVSSFGFGGTNSHVMLEEYMPSLTAAPSTKGDVLLILSARNTERLRESAAGLRDYIYNKLESGLNVPLHDIAFTLQTGRASFSEKLALVISDPEQAVQYLGDFAAGNTSKKVLTSRSDKASELQKPLEEDYGITFLRHLVSDGKLDALARLWLSGVTIDWKLIFEPRRIVSLPTYPFAKRHFWLNSSSDRAETIAAPVLLKKQATTQPNPQSTTVNPAQKNKTDGGTVGSDTLQTQAHSFSKRAELSQSGESEAVESTHRQSDGKHKTVEEVVTQKVATLLNAELDALDPCAPLSDFGLDSIMSMSLVNELKAHYDIPLYVAEVLRHSTIRDLSAYLSKEFELDGEAQQISGQDSQQNQEAATVVETPSNIEIADIPSSVAPVLFVLSSPRSGSTLLRTMLQGHADLFAPPELHLLGFQTLEERQKSLKSTGLDQGLAEAIKYLQGATAEDAQQLLDTMLNEQASIAQVYEKLQALASPGILVDKSPSYGAKPETLSQGKTLFPHAKYIHLVRDPKAVMESIVRNRFDKMLGHNNDDPWQIAEQTWTSINKNISHFLNDIAPENQLVVLYEELVRHPEAALNSICQFLGIELDPDMLEPYKGEKMTSGLHANSMSVGDPNFLQHTAIDASQADKWKDALPNDLNLREDTHALAVKFGYVEPKISLTPAQVQSMSRGESELGWYIVQHFALEAAHQVDDEALEIALAKVLRANPQLSLMRKSLSQLSEPSMPPLLKVIPGCTSLADLPALQSKLTSLLGQVDGILVSGAVCEDEKTGLHIVLAWHHFFVDGISTTYLSEQIKSLLRNPAQEVSAGNPDEYLDYLAAIERMQNSENVISEPAVCQLIQKNPVKPLLAELEQGENLYRHQQELHLVCSLELLQEIENMASYSVYECLGAALVKSLMLANESDRVALAVRMHGRNLDTYGSFPKLAGNFACDVVLGFEDLHRKSLMEQFSESAKTVACSGAAFELWRQKNKASLPWESSQVRFNYQPLLNSPDTSLVTNEHLAPASERRYLIDFIARHHNNRLILLARFSEQCFKKQTIKNLLTLWTDNIRKIVNTAA